MNFSDFINSAVCNQEPQKGLYGQTVSNYYCLKNIKIKESLKITDTESLWVSFNDKENRLDIYFILLYKKYNLAEIGLELSSPFQFEFIAKSEKKSTIQDAILLLDDEFNFTFSIELTAEKIILNAKNENLEFQLTTCFKEIEFDIDFLNKTWFIDLLETKENNNLCHTLCKKITDEQLTIIASADYGFDADAFKDLKFIRDNAALPEKISFSLLETLSLTRYAKPVTTMGHQERLFACCCLALIENMDSVESEDGDILYALILSVIALGKKVLGQARTFLFNVLAKNKNTNSVHTIAYLILCCDLLLKDEKAFNGTFSFLKEINILEETNFEYESILTAKRVKDIPPPFMMFFIYKIVLIKQP